MAARYVRYENPAPMRWTMQPVSEEDPLCRAHCEPIADAILAGLEGVGEVTLLHFPDSAPMRAHVWLRELDLRVYFVHPIYTIEDAEAQLPTVRSRIALALELGETGWMTSTS